MKIMISQPRNNVTDVEAIKLRALAEAEVVKEKCDCVKPAGNPNEVLKAKNRQAYFMSRVLTMLAFEVDAVYFLNGWESNSFCKLEHDVCKAFDIPVYYEPFASNFFEVSNG